MDYSDFIKQKTHSIEPKPVCDNFHGMPRALFDFQKECVKRALHHGRYAIFADTGLGKTLMQLAWSQMVMKHHGPVLILAPLAVKEQTIRESEKFGVGVGVHVQNYEQLHNVDVSEFSGVVLDESSILKNLTGKVRNQIIDVFSDTPFKLACTATPAPNDHTELGNHSAFLGVLPHHEMLSEYFVHDAAKTQDWRLKGHAKKDFWKWVAGWSVTLSSPADIGFDGSSYILPELNQEQIDISGGPVFGLTGFRDLAKLRRETVDERARKIADAVNDDKPALIWCDYNEESSRIANAIPDAVEVAGSMPAKEKAARMLDFSDGNVRALVTKPKIAGFGMNWQHCNRVFFAGPSHSFEQRYQSIRRCWRFGQKKPVTVSTCATMAEQVVLRSIEKKQFYHDQSRSMGNG